MGVPPYRHSERSVGIQRSESKSSACVHSTQIAIYHLRQRRKYQASDIAKLRLEFLSLLELIVCIGCAVAEQKPSKALGNSHHCVIARHTVTWQSSVANQTLPLACVARKLQSTTCAKGANTKQAI